MNKNCIVFNSNSGEKNTIYDFPFQSSGILINYEEDGNGLQIAYNTAEQTAKYRAKIPGERYQGWSDLSFNQEKLLEVSPKALSSCDLNDVIRQNKFYLLIDSVSCTSQAIRKVPVKSENEAHKKPEPLLQIQCQNRHMNHDFAGVLQLRSDPSEGIASLPDSEAAFNIAAFA